MVLRMLCFATEDANLIELWMLDNWRLGTDDAGFMVF